MAFAPDDERTAERLSDALGTATAFRAQRNLSGKRLSAWLSHTSNSEQETPSALLTPDETLQLAQDDALVQVSGVPPIHASKLQYYAGCNFVDRRLPPSRFGTDAFAECCQHAQTTGLGKRVRSGWRRAGRRW